MQLVAYGAQDIYLTGNPQITFFKVVYRRHTNFSMECIQQTFNGSVGTAESSVTATISRNGETVRSCLMLAVQANGKKITTVEGLNSSEMEIVKDCFVKNNAMQCGFCSSGMLMTTYEIIKSKRKHSREEIREMISGNYCRCTGYQAIVDAVEDSLNKINVGV